jgi:hypothetical protein
MADECWQRTIEQHGIAYTPQAVNSAQSRAAENNSAIDRQAASWVA